MIIKEPCIITSRLLPGFRVGEGEVSIEYSDRPGSRGRTRYRYYIDLPGFEYSEDDLQSGACGGSLQEGLESLCSFLTACGEAVAYADRTGREAENEDLFPPAVAEWCHANSDELSMIGCVLEEMEGVIVE